MIGSLYAPIDSLVDIYAIGAIRGHIVFAEVEERLGSIEWGDCIKRIYRMCGGLGSNKRPDEIFNVSYQRRATWHLSQVEEIFAAFILVLTPWRRLWYIIS